MKHQVSIRLLLMGMLFVMCLPLNVVGFILKNPLNKDVQYRAKYQGKHQGVLDKYYTIKAGEQKVVAATFTPLEHADAGRNLKIITLYFNPVSDPRGSIANFDKYSHAMLASPNTIFDLMLEEDGRLGLRLHEKESAKKNKKLAEKEQIPPPPPLEAPVERKAKAARKEIGMAPPIASWARVPGGEIPPPPAEPYQEDEGEIPPPPSEDAD